MESQLPRILFDLDGTLTDPALGLTRCFAHALQSLGRPVPAETVLHDCIGPPIQATFAELLGACDDADRGSDASKGRRDVSEAVAIFRERYSVLGLYENHVYPGIVEVLTMLRSNGFSLYIATSKPTIYATEVLRHFSLDPFFAAVYGSELSGERTDKAEVIAYLLDREAIPAVEAIMVGDRKHDIRGARANRLSGAIGVTYGYGSAEELAAAGADALCASPADLGAEILARAEPGKPWRDHPARWSGRTI
jgi:phosphoglycolate phosphatase